jgi:hypothetical protein
MARVSVSGSFAAGAKFVSCGNHQARRESGGAGRVAGVVAVLLVLLSGPLPAGASGLSAGGSVTPLSQVTVYRKGEKLAVQGMLMRSDNYTTGFQLYLADGTGLVSVTLAEATYDKIVRADLLRPGAWVRVEGNVLVYRGQAQILLMRGEDIKVISPTLCWCRVPSSTRCRTLPSFRST